MLSKVVKDIKSLKIQGATNIALAGVDALRSVILNSRPSFLRKDLVKARTALFNSRPNEPMLRNMIDYVINSSSDPVELVRVIDSLKFKVEKSKKRMALVGKGLLKKDCTVFTHCHASSVMSVLKSAKRNVGMVYCTESRPRFQGRLTAKELVRAGLPVTMILDSSVADYVKNADFFLIGCDVISSTNVINKVGSRMISLLCDKYDVSLYVCSLSYKFSPESVDGLVSDIESRSVKEVWSRPPKGLVIKNPAFDVVDFEAITGFVTEYGILPPDSFINLMQLKKNKLFD